MFSLYIPIRVKKNEERGERVKLQSLFTLGAVHLVLLVDKKKKEKKAKYFKATWI